MWTVLREHFEAHNRWVREWLTDVEKLLERVARLVGAELDDPKAMTRGLLLLAAGQRDEAMKIKTAIEARRHKAFGQACDTAAAAIRHLWCVKDAMAQSDLNNAALESFLLGTQLQLLSDRLARENHLIFRGTWLLGARKQQRVILELFRERDTVTLQECFRSLWSRRLATKHTLDATDRGKLDTAVRRVNVALEAANCPLSLSVRGPKLILG
jgi:hypothetical protein